LYRLICGEDSVPGKIDGSGADQTERYRKGAVRWE
jgi:hypothetical protein